MTQDQINQAEWSNPDNWKTLTYSSARDSRVFVPKRIGVGVTMNFGHKGAKWAMAGILVVALLPGFFVLWDVLGKK
jgi:uncharacterized membrane protein